jgi:TolA-binding protein
MHGRLFRLLAAPVVILTTGACFATRNDVRILQQDLQTVRAERMAADSALLRAIEAVSTELTRVGVVLAEVGDTARVSHATTMRLRGDVREDLQAIRQQLIMIQELTGQSQRRIQELRAEMEARAAELSAQEANQATVPVPVPVPTPAGTRPGTARPTSTTPPAATPAATPAPARPAAAPGPAQLYQLGQDQLRRGSVSSARAAYTELLDKHPSSDLADEALYGIAETWADEGNGVAADSVYALVVQRFPRSSMAPNALYKRASAYRAVGRTAQAEALYKQIVAEYPQSDAALLAQEFLRPRTP